MNKKIDNILTRIAGLYGFDILWKGIGGNFHECGLAPERTLHCNEFCRAVKNDPARLRQCSENDNRFMLMEAEQRRIPFVRSCHAGVSELVIPLFSGERCTEVLLLGIFRKAHATCPYPALRETFSKLPVHADGDFKGAASILSDLLPILHHYRESLPGQAGQIRDHRIAEAVRIIQQCFVSGITAGELAAKLYLSESRFLHLFKANTGKTLIEYLNHARLEYAAKLLQNTDLRISEVMDKSGFQDQSYFCTLFKKHSGLSPLAYRRRFGHPPVV